jgi:hypothetical protein
MGVARFVPPTPLHGPRAPSQRGGSANTVRAAAWLTGGRIALLVQHQAPPYASRITRRTLVVMNTATQRMTGTPVNLRGGIVAFASAADHLVVVACRNGTSSLLAADVATSQSWTVPLGVRCSVEAPPALAIRPDGTAAAVVGANAAPVLVDLSSGTINHMQPLTALGNGAQPNSRLVLTWIGDSIAVTGFSTGPGQLNERGLGVALLDPSSGATHLVTRRGSNILVVGDTLVVSGFDPTGPSRGKGTGLTAYASDGTRLWHADGTRLVWPFETDQRVYAPRSVKRHTIVDVYDLRTGKAVASLFQRGNGVRPITGVIDSLES